MSQGEDVRGGRGEKDGEKEGGKGRAGKREIGTDGKSGERGGRKE